jgi:phosphohistidine phosphatase
MELLVVRHGIAVDHGTPGLSDAERPLTEEGERKFKEAARGLACLLPPPDVLLSSPLVRARQTADIAAKAWGGVRVTIVRALAGGAPREILAALDEYRDRNLVATFGHEPDASSLVAFLLGSTDSDRFAFKKGGAALLEVPPGSAAAGQLVWFLSQKVLRGVRD